MAKCISHSHLLPKLKYGKNKELFVQSNLFSANHAPENLDFKYTYAESTAHARRQFWRFRAEDPLNTYFFLRGFALLNVLKAILDIHERREEGNIYWQQKYALKIRNILKRRVEIMILQHMPRVDLQKAANYIIKKFEELTRYLYGS